MLRNDTSYSYQLVVSACIVVPACCISYYRAITVFRIEAVIQLYAQIHKEAAFDTVNNQNSRTAGLHFPGQ
jgi:hypothetical protein